MEEPGSTLADTCSCSGTSLLPAGAGAPPARKAGVVLSPFAPLCARQCAVSFNDLFLEREPGLGRAPRRTAICDFAKPPDLIGCQPLRRVDAHIDMPGDCVGVVHDFDADLPELPGFRARA